MSAGRHSHALARAWLAAGACLLLTACPGTEDEPAATDTQAEPRETVFDPLTDTLDRAQGVEDTLREQSEELRRRVEEAEGR